MSDVIAKPRKLKGCLKSPASPTSFPLTDSSPNSPLCSSSPRLDSGSRSANASYASFADACAILNSDRPKFRKCVSFCSEDQGLEEVHVADEWDRTPTEPVAHLSYQDILELKAIQRTLPRAQQLPDPFTGKPASQYLSTVPIGLLPLTDSNDSIPSPPLHPPVTSAHSAGCPATSTGLTPYTTSRSPSHPYSPHPPSSLPRSSFKSDTPIPSNLPTPPHRPFPGANTPTPIPLNLPTPPDRQRPPPPPSPSLNPTPIPNPNLFDLSHLAPSTPRTPMKRKPNFAFLPLLETPASSSSGSGSGFGKPSVPQSTPGESDFSGIQIVGTGHRRESETEKTTVHVSMPVLPTAEHTPSPTPCVSVGTQDSTTTSPHDPYSEPSSSSPSYTSDSERDETSSGYTSGSPLSRTTSVSSVTTPELEFEFEGEFGLGLGWEEKERLRRKGKGVGEGWRSFTRRSAPRERNGERVPGSAPVMDWEEKERLRREAGASGFDSRRSSWAGSRAGSRESSSSREGEMRKEKRRNVVEINGVEVDLDDDNDGDVVEAEKTEANVVTKTEKKKRTVMIINGIEVDLDDDDDDKGCEAQAPADVVVEPLSESKARPPGSIPDPEATNTETKTECLESQALQPIPQTHTRADLLLESSPTPSLPETSLYMSSETANPVDSSDSFPLKEKEESPMPMPILAPTKKSSTSYSSPSPSSLLDPHSYSPSSLSTRAHAHIRALGPSAKVSPPSFPATTTCSSSKRTLELSSPPALAASTSQAQTRTKLSPRLSISLKQPKSASQSLSLSSPSTSPVGISPLKNKVMRCSSSRGSNSPGAGGAGGAGVGASAAGVSSGSPGSSSPSPVWVLSS